MPLHRGPNDGPESEAQRAAPERRVEQRQPQADTKGGTNKAANP